MILWGEALKIRALTLYANPPNNFNEADLWIAEKANLLREAAEKIESQTNLEIWTRRISIYLPKDEDVETITEEVRKYSDIKFMIYQRTVSQTELRLLKKVVASGAYSALITESEQDLMKAATAIEAISSDEPTNATRVAFEFSGQMFETAYFPLSLHAMKGPDRFAMALLYPTDALNARGNIGEALKATLEKIYSEIKGFLKDGLLGNKVSGIDYSLSPWMEESVARFIQEKGNCSFENLDCLEEVRKANNVLSDFARDKGGIGFNEIMLPLGEDDELKSMVEQGKLTLKDFLIYSTVCVAGIDMIPLYYQKGELTRVLKSSYAIARQKRRPYGVRLIPVKDNRRKIRLDGFGEVPVMVFV
ncbi:MAG: DUF711 family protein [Fervidicoccaceae archaeon]